MAIYWIFFSFLRFVEMPYLVSLISFTPYPRIAFCLLLYVLFVSTVFFKVFYWWMNLDSVQWLIVLSINRLPPKLHDRHEVLCVYPFNIRIILCIYSKTYTTSSIIFWGFKRTFWIVLIFES